MKRLDGKVAIVTGAGQGIGKEIAIAYAKEGAKVVLATRTVSKAEVAADQISRSGGVASAVACDVAIKEQVKSVVDFTVKTYGTVDILVNNAQVFKNFTPILEHTDDDIYKVFNSGYMGSLWFMKECFPYMKEHGGKIINTASEAGIEGKKDFLAYASTKEAIRAMSRVAAREWGQYRINVNIICPLALSDTMRHEAPSEELAAMTAQIPIGLLGGPEAIAPIAVFLASSDADYLTGYTLFADGGHCMDTAR